MFGRGLKRAACITLRAFAQGVREQSPNSWSRCNVFPPSTPELCAGYSRTSSRSFYNFARNDYVHFRPQQTNRQSRRRMILLGAGGVALVVYVTHLEEVPYTHRKHFVLVSPSFEKALGIQQFQQVKQQAEAEGKLLPANHPATLQVRRIGERIAAKAAEGSGDGGRLDHMKNLQWEFVVIDEPQTTNAFVMPGGKVVVFTGILKLLRTEKEMAAVLGHEVAHVVARHIGEKLSTSALVLLLAVVLGFAIGIDFPIDLIRLVVELPNSRKIETEADIIGIHVSARACYDPAAAVIVFTKLGEMEKKKGVRTPTFLRTHPLSEERVKAIERNLPQALQDYELSGCNAPKQFFGW